MGNPKTAVTLGSFGTVMSRLHFCRGTNKIEMSRFTWDLPAIKYRSWLERSVRVCTSSRGVWPRERTPCVGAIEVHKRLVTFGFRQHSLDSKCIIWLTNCLAAKQRHWSAWSFVTSMIFFWRTIRGLIDSRFSSCFPGDLKMKVTLNVSGWTLELFGWVCFALLPSYHNRRNKKETAGWLRTR